MSLLRRFFGGKELPDPTPVAVPLKFRNHGGDDLHQRINDIVRGIDWRKKADTEGFDTFEESLDFEVDDPDDRLSPHEQFDAKQDALRNAMIDKAEKEAENNLRRHFVRRKFKGDNDEQRQSGYENRRTGDRQTGRSDDDRERSDSRRSRRFQRSDEAEHYEREEPTDRRNSSRGNERD